MNEEVDVVLYVRVSTEEQAQEGYSLDAQVEKLVEQARARGWRVVDVYRDEGRSAKTMDRPELQRMLADIRKKRIQGVMVWRSNRLSRTVRDFAEILDLLEKHDVFFFSQTEKFDTSTSIGKAMLHMAGVFAELERNTLAENVTLGQMRKAREGGWNGGAIFGYDTTSGGLRVNPLEAVVVRRIYDLFLHGKGAMSIVDDLNRSGALTKKGNPWSKQGVFLILDNPVYKGYIRYGQVRNWSDKRRKGTQERPLIVKGQHEPIIPEQEWDLVQSVRQSRTARPTQHRGHYILSGILRCPQCSAPMVGWHTARTRRDGSVRLHRYYKCSSFNSKGHSACKGNYVGADQAEREVVSRIARVVQNRALLEDLVERMNVQRTERHQPLIEERIAITKRIAELETIIGNLVAVVEKGNAPNSIVKRLAEQEENLRSLHNRRSKVDDQLQEATEEAIAADTVWNALKNFQQAFELSEAETQKQLLSALLERITVTNERVVDQVLLAFDPLSLLDLLQPQSVTFTYDTAPRG